MNEFSAGALSGSIGTIISHPLDTLKTWKQTDYKITNLKAKDVFRGWKFPVYNSLIINSIMFGGNNKIKEDFNNEFISGGITGSFIGIITNPLDLYKIKSQNKKGPAAPASIPGHSPAPGASGCRSSAVLPCESR